MTTTLVKRIKHHISEYFISTNWPWEIMSGLFIPLIFVNNFKTLLTQLVAGNVLLLLLLILTISIFWGIVDGVLFIFTALLTRGQYNKTISRINSGDQETALNSISNELDNTIIGTLNENTKNKIFNEILESSGHLDRSLISTKILKKDIYGALLAVVLISLPSIIILPTFLFLKDLNLAIFISDVIGLIIFFGFGYRLGYCTNKNKILTGILTLFVGGVFILLAFILGA